MLNGALYLNIVIKLIFILNHSPTNGKSWDFFHFKVHCFIQSYRQWPFANPSLKSLLSPWLLVPCPIILNKSLLVAIRLHRQQAEVHAVWHRGHYKWDSCCWLNRIVSQEKFISLHCFPGVDWHNPGHKSVAPLPDQPLGASRRETGLQAQKAPVASPVTSKQTRFSLGIQNIQRDTPTPNASTPEQEMNAILQRVCSVIIHATKGQKAPLEYLHVTRRKGSAGFRPRQHFAAI